ncbi:MAG: HYR domain-containing protein [Planctomycetota bacterium]
MKIFSVTTSSVVSSLAAFKRLGLVFVFVFVSLGLSGTPLTAQNCETGSEALAASATHVDNSGSWLVRGQGSEVELLLEDQGSWITFQTLDLGLQTLHSLDLDGTLLAIGLGNEVRIHSYDGTSWVEEFAFGPADPATSFGHSVALSGNRLAVGDPNNNTITFYTRLFNSGQSASWFTSSTNAGSPGGTLGDELEMVDGYLAAADRSLGSIQLFVPVGSPSLEWEADSSLTLSHVSGFSLTSSGGHLDLLVPSASGAQIYRRAGAGWDLQSDLSFTAGTRQYSVLSADKAVVTTDCGLRLYSQEAGVWDSGVELRTMDAAAACMNLHGALDDSPLAFGDAGIFLSTASDLRLISGLTYADCNGNGLPDSCDLAAGTPDCNDNGIPDSCDFANGGQDCNANGVIDVCEINNGFAADCNGNQIPDPCDALNGVQFDTVPPVIAGVPENQNIVLSPGVCAAIADWVEPTATDVCSNATISSDVALGSELFPGINTITFTAEDDHGNQSTASFTVTVSENIPPVLAQLPFIPDFDADPQTCTAIVTWDEPTASDICSDVTVTSSHPNGSEFPLGETLVVFTATDVSGNTDIDGFIVRVVDNSAPSIEQLPNIEVSAPATACNATVDWIDPVVSDCTGGVILTQNFVQPLVGLPGVRNVTYTATDANGLSSTMTFTVNIIDDTPPTLVGLPADMVLNTDPGACGATVLWDPPTVVDNCDLELEPVSNFDPPSTFGVGVTTVVYTAIDPSGNERVGSFTVTVNDLDVPVFVSTPGPVSAATSTADCSEPVTWNPPIAIDCSANLTYTASHDPGTPFPLGTTDVTYEVSDLAGFFSTITFPVTVTDGFGPTFQGVPADITQAVTPGECSSLVTWIEPTATDSCGTSTISGSHTPDTVFPVGVTPVTYTAIDDSGNVSTSTFNVTVTDGNAPAFSSVVTDQSSTAAIGICQAQIFWDEPTATDDCADVVVTSSHASGSFFDKGVTTVTYTASDGGGEVDQFTFNVTVTDVEAPSLLNMPADITVGNVPGACANTVFWLTPTAFDHCEPVGFAASHVPGTSFPVGQTEVTYTSTDSSGNTATASFMILVEDRDAPTFVDTLPSMTTVIDPGTCGAVVTWDEPLALDACDAELTITSNHQSGDIFPVGSTLVTYAATDDFNNTTNLFFNVVVEDNEGPTIVGIPQSFTAGVDEGVCGATVTWQEPAPLDCQSMTVQKSHDNPAFLPLGDTTVTYIVTDASGNATTDSFVITVVDDLAPTFTAFPENISVSNDQGTCEAIVTWEPLQTSDPCSTSSFTLSHESGSVFPQGVTTVTATAVDLSGNSRQQSFTVSVLDAEAPVLLEAPSDPVFVGNSTQECDAVANWTVPSFIDNCGGAVTVTSNHQPGEIFPVGETLVSYSALDADLNETNHSFTVIVLDTTDPTVEQLPEPVHVSTPIDSCTAVVTWPEPVATDCGQVTATSDFANGAELGIGSHIITYTFSDDSGNSTMGSFLVVVSDGENPTISNMPQDVTVTNTTPMCGVNVIWSEPSTSDCTFSSMTASHSPGDLFSMGVTEVLYTSIDTEGNQSTASFLVTVLDGESPQIIDMPTDITVTADLGSCQAAATWGDPQAIDCVSADLASSHLSGSLFDIGTTEVIYTATDAAGNSSQASFHVTVIDQEAPQIANMPDTVIVQNSPGLCTGVATWSAPSGTDCSGIASITPSIPSGSEFPVGTTTVFYSVIDNSGLESVDSFLVEVQDTEAPTIINLPGTVTVSNVAGNCSGPATWETPSTEDCSGSFITSDYNSGQMFVLGSTTVTYTAMDEWGNSSQSSFEVIVEDTESPFFTNLPATMSFSSTLGTCEGLATWPMPTAADLCSAAADVTVTSSHASGSVFAIGDHTVVFTAMDASGNEHAQLVTISIIDIEPPTISDMPADLVGTALIGECGVPMSWNPPVTSDCSDVTLTSTFSSGDLIPIGLNTITYTATDSAGNSSSSSFFVNVADAEAPTISNLPENVILTNDFDSCGAIHSWVEPIIEDCSDLMPISISHSSGSFFEPGITEITYSATDFYGNTSTQSFTVNVVDKDGPQFLNVVSYVELNNYPGLCGANAFWPEPTVVDNCEVANLQSTVEQGDFLPLGETVVNYVAIDSEGNANTTSITINVIDNEAPQVINLPAHIFAEPDPSTCTAIVTWQAPEISDNCDGGTITSSHESGTEFEVGTHTVTVIATDAVGFVTEVSFQITVNECGVSFIRGDTNNDGAYDISDAIGILQYIFGGAMTDPTCLDSLDENDDGMISIADAIYHFSHLFSGGPTPVAPFDSCGVDMTADDLGCESYGVCP